MYIFINITLMIAKPSLNRPYSDCSRAVLERERGSAWSHGMEEWYGYVCRTDNLRNLLRGARQWVIMKANDEKRWKVGIEYGLDRRG